MSKRASRYEVIEQIPHVGNVLKDNAERGGDKYLFVPEGGGLFPIDYLWENFGHKPEVREVRQSLGV
jgi:hypothetical protein